MDKAAQDGELVQEILRMQQLPAIYGEIEVEKIFLPDQGHYQLMTVGWHGQHRIHGCVLHVDIKGGKIWNPARRDRRGDRQPAGRGRGATRRYRSCVPFAVHAEIHGFRRELTVESKTSHHREQRSFALATTLQHPYPEARGSHGPTIEAQPLAGIFLPTSRCSRRRLENGLTALVYLAAGRPWWWSTCTTPSVPSTSRLASRAWLHFVEHMLFKGTERYPKGQIDRLVTAAAGQCNAETGEDSTRYWFTFPSERWELALAIEADRMCAPGSTRAKSSSNAGSSTRSGARELNSPQGRLDQNHLAVSYLRHPYRNPILGWPEDAVRIGVDDLHALLPPALPARWCGPRRRRRRRSANASSTGSRRSSRPSRRARCRVRAHGVAEPRQSGRRDFTLARGRWRRARTPGLAYRAAGPSRRRRADVLSDLLSCGRRSRLWQALVEDSAMATWVEARTRRRSGRGNS